MTRRKLLSLAVSAAVLLGAGVWLSAHRADKQSDTGGGVVFADLKPALAQVTEVRLSKGDGSSATLRKGEAGWVVVERNYPADGARVRELVLNLASMKVVETKTSDPANYSKLGVEAPSPTAGSTLVEVKAGDKSWALLVGKSAGGRTLYARKPKDAASALVEPVVTVDSDQKPWLDRMITEIPGADVHDIAVQHAGATYSLTREKRGGDFALAPLPKGRAPAMANFTSHAETLSSLFFDEVRAVPDPAPAVTDHTTYRTFDGQVLEISGHRDQEKAKAYIRVAVRRDAALAAQFPAPAPAAGAPAADAPAAKPAAKTVERLAGRVTGVEYEIPIYKYEALFKPADEQLEPLPEKKK